MADMEYQTEGLGLRPPGVTEEITSDTAEHGTAGGAAEETELGIGDELPAPGEGLPAPGEGLQRGGLPGDGLPAGEQRPVTGEPRVDAALARLDELEGLPVTEHRAVFEDVHRRLREVLGELDASQPQGAGRAAGSAGRPGR
jgi:hypothetical protein